MFVDGDIKLNSRLIGKSAPVDGFMYDLARVATTRKNVGRKFSTRKPFPIVESCGPTGK